VDIVYPPEEPGGEPTVHHIGCKFAILNEEQLDDYASFAMRYADPSKLLEVLRDWKPGHVADAAGTPLACTEETKRLLLGDFIRRRDIHGAYLNSLTKVAEKNSRTPPAG
jgi:hypothetical protein